MNRRIEEAIQTRFRNEWQRAMVNLIYTYNWVAEQLKNHLAQADLSYQQYNVLRILRGSAKPLSTLQIRERMLDRSSDTSRIVDRLVVKGLVEKYASTRDKRLVDVTISAAGLTLLEELDKQNEQLDATMNALTEEEAKQLNDLLDKLRGG